MTTSYPSLQGKTIMITDASSGIGKATATQLAKMMERKCSDDRPSK